jgi:hypothetical protein
MRWGKRLYLGCLTVLVLLSVALGGSALAREGYFRPACQAGSVTLGHRPGRILFKARCFKRHDNKFSFVLGRGDRRGKHVTISSFSLKPSTRGPGAAHRRGRCERLRQEVACDAYANGWITMKGWLTVPVTRECRSEITMTQVVPSKCNPSKDGACEAVLRVSSLFQGLPRGC